MCDTTPLVILSNTADADLKWWLLAEKERAAGEVLDEPDNERRPTQHEPDGGEPS